MKNPRLIPMLAAGVGSVLAAHVSAQTFNNLHSFLSVPWEGNNPCGNLALSGNTLYGTTWTGGCFGSGTVFSLNTDGSGFMTLHDFWLGSHGAMPYAGLILSGSTLYGTTLYGGEADNGTVFAAGSSFMNLHSFSPLQSSVNGDGANPWGGLVLSSNTLYGTAFRGGLYGFGTVYAVNTDGTGFTNLHNFSGANDDGANPYASLIVAGNVLYGTTELGGTSNFGIVFGLNTDGTGFTILHSFSGTNDDGAHPQASLILSGNTMYGTTRVGGSAGNGTVFALNTDGTGFTNLHSFTALNNGTNSDGFFPWAGLSLSGNTLYGTTYGRMFEGDSSGNGTVFALNTDGTGFAVLHSFTGLSDGANPYAGLISSGTTWYGTAYHAGFEGNGTVFSLFIPPRLTISSAAKNVVLTWPTNAIGFGLQSTTNLVSPVVWTAVSPPPVVVNGQNTVTNPSSATQRFFRLSQ